MGQSKFSYELTFWFISIENGGKQKSKNTLRVEINQFCDGYRDTMRSSYAIGKMLGFNIAPDKAAYCVFTQFRKRENAIKFISVRTKTQ